jgi:hypothetical protein
MKWIFGFRLDISSRIRRMRLDVSHSRCNGRWIREWHVDRCRKNRRCRRQYSRSQRCDRTASYSDSNTTRKLIRLRCVQLWNVRNLGERRCPWLCWMDGVSLNDAVTTAVYYASVRCDRTELRMQICSDAFGMRVFRITHVLPAWW